ncbi:hypothetical protein BK140_10980 [Paenibacillus macerans]|nr:hypothetical protein BK140_10980 [Paenibacillus macerans]
MPMIKADDDELIIVKSTAVGRTEDMTEAAEFFRELALRPALETMIPKAMIDRVLPRSIDTVKGIE